MDFHPDDQPFWHDEPPSRIRFAAFWIFTTIFSALILLAVVAAGMRMVGV